MGFQFHGFPGGPNHGYIFVSEADWRIWTSSRLNQNLFSFAPRNTVSDSSQVADCAASVGDDPLTATSIELNWFDMNISCMGVDWIQLSDALILHELTHHNRWVEAGDVPGSDMRAAVEDVTGPPSQSEGYVVAAARSRADSAYSNLSQGACSD